MNWKVGAVLLVTAGFLVAVLWGLDLGEVRACLEDFSWIHLLPMGLLYLSAHLLRVLRFRLLLGVPVPYFRLLSVNSIGFLAINVVPLRLGELVRPYLLLEQHGVAFGRSLAAVFVERLLDMLMLLVMLLLVGVVVDLPAGGVAVFGVDVVTAGQRMAALVLVLGAAGLGSILAVGEPAIRWVERLLARLSPAQAPRAAGLLRAFRGAVGSVARRPLQALALLVLSVALWALTIAGLWMVFAGAGRGDLGLGGALVFWAIVLSAMTAVPTPGFVGAFEAAGAAALGLLGLHRDAAVTLTVLIHAGQFAFTVGLGALFLVAEGLSLRQVVARSRAVGSGDPPVPLSRDGAAD